MDETSDLSGNRRSPVDVSPFYFGGQSVSVLLVHGLGGTPYEMRFLGEQLARRGYRVLGVKLAGHAEGPEELSATGCDAWYKSVVVGFEQLRQFGDPIVAIGQSAGAVLATRLAVDQGAEVAALVLLAPAFFLTPLTRVALTALRIASPWATRIFLRTPGPDLHDAAAKLVHPSLRVIPLNAVLELTKLASMVRSHLRRVMQPVLIIHSRQDHTCPPSNVDFLLSRLGSQRKRVVFLEESYHVVSVDSEKERVAAEIANFIAQLWQDCLASGSMHQNVSGQ